MDAAAACKTAGGLLPVSEMWRAITVILVISAPASVVAQSPPWCEARSLSVPERMICADPVLSRLDLELNEVYSAAHRVEPDLGQIAWLSERDACRLDVYCLEDAYRSRIAELRSVAAGESAGVPEAGSRLILPPGDITTTTLPPRDNPDTEDWQREPWALPPGRRAPEASAPLDPEREQARLEPPLDALAPDPQLAELDDMLPRPWCSSERLNPTERTICAEPDLSRLDALLEVVYGRTTARNDDAAQLSWLRLERDACGTDLLCIAHAYSARLRELDR